MKRIQFHKPRDVLRVTPKKDGKYTFVFTGLYDANYPEGMPIQGSNGEQVMFSHVIHPQPNAFFTPDYGSRRQSKTKVGQRWKKCVGDAVQMDVSLEGSGPWALTYEVLEEQRGDRMLHTLEHIPVTGKGEVTVHTIDLGAFNTSGQYTVNLVRVKDRNGCSKAIDSGVHEVEVRAERPRVVFAGDEEMSLLDGDWTLLPLRLSGYEPWQVVYDVQLESGETKRLVERGVRDANYALRVNQPGTYSLVGVQDAFCNGEVGSGDRGPVGHSAMRVTRTPKPYIVLSLEGNQSVYTKEHGVIQRHPTCEGEESTMDFEMRGKGPWYVHYKVKESSSESLHEHEYSEKEEQQVQLHSVGRIGLVTQQAGWYYYALDSVRDENYNMGVPLQIRDVHDRVLDVRGVFHHVKARPRATFTSTDAFACASSGNQTDNANVTLSLQGVAPFSFQIEVKHENQPTQVHYVARVDSHEYTLDTGLLFGEVGRFTVSVTHLKDATGCTATDTRASLAFTMYDSASIQAMSAPPNVACLHDVLTFTLQGNSPWRIQYALNSQPQPDILHSHPLFQIQATQPGTVNIIKVCRVLPGGHTCCEYPKDVGYQVYDEPEGYISGGEDRVDNIREGFI
jgi:nucleoporin POM152